MSDSKSRPRRYAPVGATILLLALAGLLILALGGGGEASPDRRPLSPRERKAERIERRSAAKPGDLKLQLAAIETWIEAGSDRLGKIDVEVEEIPAAVREDFEAGMRIWGRYRDRLKSKADADIIELAGEVSFELAEIGSRDLGKIEADVARAADALRIVGRYRPTLYTLSNVAVFAFFNGEFARGNVAGRAAAAGFKKRSRRKIVTEQIDYYRENAKVFRRILDQAASELRESGDDLLEKPLKLYSGRTGLNKDNPTE
jgi:hypothetical protein